MEFKNGLPNQIQDQEPSKDLMMEDLSGVDPKVTNSEEKSSTFTHHSFFHGTFSRNTFKLSTIKDVSIRMQERAKNVKASRVITLIVILTIIGVFSIPVILFYALKTDPSPALNSEFTNSTLCSYPNISTVDSNCSKDVIYTYESLTMASNFTNKFCTNATYEMFCEALEHCSIGQDADARKLLCTQVRQNICTTEWRILEVNNRSEELIDCQGFGETSQPNCTEQFDLADNNSVCLPLCKEFSLSGPRFTNFLVGLTAIAHLMNVVGGIIVIIACIWNKAKMFKFPQILTLLNTCMLISVSFMIMLSNISMGSWNPICSQKFLTGHNGARDEPSAFCQIQGMIIVAGFVTYSMYWLLYAFHLYMKVAQPQYSRLLDSWHRSKKFYYFEVGLFTVIGTLPYIVLAGLSKFNIYEFPPTACGPSAAGNFYGFVLPTLIVNCSTLIILLLVLYHVHIHMGIFKKSKKYWLCQITAPEVKIFLIFCYLLIFFVALWTTISYYMSKADKLESVVSNYFRCSINGIHMHDERDCEKHRREFEGLSLRWLHVLFLLLGAFLNISNLPLIIEYKKVKDMILSTLGRDTIKETEIPSHMGKQSKLLSHAP